MSDIQLHENKLPTIQELFKDPALMSRVDNLNHYLNQDPPESWVKKHPFIKNYRYLPIDKGEFLLRMFFKRYKIEVIKTGMLLNSVEVVTRVHYVDPITGEWMFHDGVGAKELQTVSGSGILKTDMSNLNPGAVQMALPIAKTVSEKDAFDHFGKIFGCDLNRKDTLGYMRDEKLAELVLTVEEQRMAKLIEKAKDRTTLETLKSHLTESLNEQYNLKWNQLEQEK